MSFAGPNPADIHRWCGLSAADPLCNRIKRNESPEDRLSGAFFDGLRRRLLGNAVLLGLVFNDVLQSVIGRVRGNLTTVDGQRRNGSNVEILGKLLRGLNGGFGFRRVCTA